jgi:hypothetical protein
MSKAGYAFGSCVMIFSLAVVTDAFSEAALSSRVVVGYRLKWGYAVGSAWDHVN